MSRFKGKLVKMIKDVGSKFKFSDYSISPKVRQILLHWGYELTEEDFFNELTNERIKMSYYWFNRLEISQTAKEKYFREKTTEYYAQNKKAIKERSRERYKNLSQEKQRTKLGNIKEKSIKNWFNIKKNR